MARMLKGDSTQLLSGEQQEASLNRNNPKFKKKNLFTKVFSKTKKHDAYKPPTAPNTPEGVDVVDVTVVASEYDPSLPYEISTTISELSDGHNANNATAPRAATRKVGFVEDEEQELILTNHPHVNTYQQSSMASLGDTKTTVTQTVPDTCSESYMNQTLGFFDDICQIPPQPSQAGASTAAPPQWGTVPSEDDDTTYRDSLMSTVDESTVDRTTSVHTGTTKTGTTTAAKSKATAAIDDLPKPAHENFEVVLDSSILQGSAKQRRGWFSNKKEGDEEQEEEKKDEDNANTMDIDTTMEQTPIQFEPEATRSPKKSLVKRLFSVIKKKDEENDGLMQSQAVYGIDFVESTAVLSTTEEAIERTYNNEDEGTTNDVWDNLLDQLEPVVTVMTTDDSWNKMLNLLETSEDKPKKEEKKNKSKKNHRRNLSWSAVAKTLAKPIVAVRKRSKDDSNVKYQGPKPPLSSPKKGSPPKKPKPMWKAVKDPNSNKTYYYHRKTRETSWTKPEELKTYEEQMATTPHHKNQTNAQSPSRAQPKAAGFDSSNREANATFSTPTRKSSHNKESVSASPEPESPIKPPRVIDAALTAESQAQISKAEQGLLDRSLEQQHLEASTGAGPSKFDNMWEKKREIERLLTGLSPPDKSSVDMLMSEYEGKEDLLLRQLREKVESQPFDEPFLDEPADTMSNEEPSPMSAHRLHSRTTTYMSKTSATTKSSTKTDKTDRIKNTFSNKSLIETISENLSTSTSISSRHEEDRLEPIMAPSKSRYTTANPKISSKGPVPRERDLKVEELTGARVTAEILDSNGRVVLGRKTDVAEAEEGSYYGDNEVETYGDDSVSALSDHETDFLHRKENYDAARRRALDDAIEREDWDLAAALSEGMGTSNKPADDAKSHVSWNQSELDKFIANNDWDAVKSYIARMRDRKNGVKTSGKVEDVIASPSKPKRSAAAKAPSRPNAAAAPADLTQDTALKKRIGSKSQLQHRELMSESSWTSDSSYDDSYDSDYS